MYIIFKNKCFYKSGQHGKTAANVVFRVYLYDSTQTSSSWITSLNSRCKRVGREDAEECACENFSRHTYCSLGMENTRWWWTANAPTWTELFFYLFLLTSFCRLKERCKQDLLGLMNRGPALSHWLLVHTRCIQHSLGMQT